MTPEHQEMLMTAHAAKAAGFKRVEIDPADLIALLDCVEKLEARVEELRRRYEPTVGEWMEYADAQAGACWG